MTENTDTGSASEGTPSQRLASLDVFRGLTMAGMVLVNNPGSWSHVYAPLRHATWHGWTPTDLVFPFFLFIVGSAMAFSLRKYVTHEKPWRAVRGRIVRRAALLFIIGVLLGGFPHYDFSSIRIPGVLQRIAVVYLIAAFVVLTVKPRGQYVLAGVLLLGYWAVMTQVAAPGSQAGSLSPDGNLARSVDRFLIGESHLYSASPTDPEGVLSTLPAIATTLFGYWAGGLLASRPRDLRTALTLAAAGLVSLTLGYFWGAVFPINKPLWTSSYVLFTAGWAMLVLAVCFWIVDVRGWRSLGRPFEILGLNAIFLYIGAALLARALINTHVHGVTTKEWVYRSAFASWLGDLNGSLAFGLGNVLAWWLVLWYLSRRGWVFKI